jgi:hypothetical protein
MPAGDDGSDTNAAYAAFHAPRFEFLIDVVARSLGRGVARLLDIGQSPLTPLLARRLGVAVDALGLEPDGPLPSGRQYHFDLNHCQDRCSWRTELGPYPAIVFAEVIEHLHTAPELVLAYLHHLLEPGGMIFIQTPNAASLRKRLTLLLGRNPYQKIRSDPSNPGHFREYTADELEID